jgi:hypothetical protein
MSFLDMNFDDVVEPRAVEPDKEYKLRIIEVREGTDKNGNGYALPRLEVLDEVGAKDFTYFLGFPHDGMDAKQLNSSKYKIKSFCDAFNLDPNAPFEDWVGAEGWAILGLNETDEWGEQNFIRRFVKS